MDFSLDTSWCPVCSREIMPKRYTVPVAPPPSQAPAAPPSSPSSSPKQQTGETTTRTSTRTKTGHNRTRGGLVHGTGRVKPNGAVKRTESTATVNKGAAAQTTTKPAQPAAPAAAAPTKVRTVIDQGPIPLYCSDECRMADLNILTGVLSIDHDPHREALSTPPVPHNSYTNLGAAGSEAESDGGSGESCSSRSWSSDSTKASDLSPSIATLAAFYDFPPMPPPPPLLESADSQSSSDSEFNFDLYQGGVIMAARRIKDTLCPNPAPRKSAFSNNNSAPAPRAPIPGWTDGSDAWRTSVYSLSSPANMPRYKGDDSNAKAYKSCVASPHRSRGVPSTLSEAATPTNRNSASTASLPATRSTAVQPTRSVSYMDDIYSKYPLSFSRRSESRATLYTASPTSLPATTSSSASVTAPRRKQERSLLKPGAEGKLLVPDVKLKVNTGSSLSLSSQYEGSWSESSYPASSRRSLKSPRSPLSRHGSEISDAGMSETSTQPDVASSLPTTKRATTETRSWSYDNLMTYPIMRIAPKKEKRVETQIVDGQMKVVEVEVDVEQPLKRLFLFPGKDSSL